VSQIQDIIQNFFKESIVDMLQISTIFAVVAIPVALLLSHVHTQYQISQTGYDIARVTREHRSLAEDYKKLQIEAAVQGRTERITNLARERYGLAPTRPEQITVVQDYLPAEPLQKMPEQHASLTP